MDNKQNFEFWKEKCLITNSAYCTLLNLPQEHNKKNYNNCCLKISVIISTHNRADSLVHLLDSIYKQTYTNYEIIIIDDASTDNTREIIKKYMEEHKINIIYFDNQINKGVSLSKRKGYELATGDIIIFSDDDDYYIDYTYFDKINQIYYENSDCVMTVASTIDYYINENLYKLSPLNFNYIISTQDYLLGFSNKYTKPASMITLSMRASALKKISYEKLKCFNDMSLYLYACLAVGKVYPIRESMAIYTIHTNSISAGTSATFIIENLDAKCDIAKRALELGYLSNIDKWIYEQCASSLIFYFSGKIKNIQDFRKVLKWIYKNITIKYRLKTYMLATKSMLKHLYSPSR